MTYKDIYTYIYEVYDGRAYRLTQCVRIFTTFNSRPACFCIYRYLVLLGATRVLLFPLLLLPLLFIVAVYTMDYIVLYSLEIHSTTSTQQHRYIVLLNG